MSKVLDEMNAKYKNQVKTTTIDVQDPKNAKLAEKFKVRYIPHLVFMDETGKVLQEKVGYAPLKEVLAIFEKHGVKIAD